MFQNLKQNIHDTSSEVTDRVLAASLDLALDQKPHFRLYVSSFATKPDGNSIAS